MILEIFLPSASVAQSKPFTKEFYLGAKGGIAFSRVKFKPNVEQNPYLGNSGGLIFRMISEPHVGIQFEANYLQKGWEEKPLEGMTQSYFHQLNYLEFPVMTHVNLGSKAFRFTFNIGPSVAFLLSESQGMNPSDPPIPAEPPIPYWGKPADSSVDFLFVGSLGTEYHFRKGGGFALDGRFSYSLTNIYDGTKYGYDPSRSSGIQVTLSYLFRLNKAKKTDIKPVPKKNSKPTKID
jgi:hypothetical protein